MRKPQVASVEKQVQVVPQVFSWLSLQTTPAEYHTKTELTKHGIRQNRVMTRPPIVRGIPPGLELDAVVDLFTELFSDIDERVAALDYYTTSKQSIVK